MKSVGSFLRLIPQLERRREAAGGSAAAVAPYDLLALKAKDTQLLIMLPALNRQTRKLKVLFHLCPSRVGTQPSAHTPHHAAHGFFQDPSLFPDMPCKSHVCMRRTVVRSVCLASGSLGVSSVDAPHLLHVSTTECG